MLTLRAVPSGIMVPFNVAMAFCAEAFSRKLMKPMPLQVPSGFVIARTPLVGIAPKGAKISYKSPSVVSVGRPPMNSAFSSFVHLPPGSTPAYCKPFLRTAMLPLPLPPLPPPPLSHEPLGDQLPPLSPQPPLSPYGVQRSPPPPPPSLPLPLAPELAYRTWTGPLKPWAMLPLRLSTIQVASSTDPKRIRAAILPAPGHILHDVTVP
mmetsp:Transcript_59704/g.194874  ORF Transcript_59704/g.194874 Transcript_59704/m.194874 type:complete len:208 (-) Transcript_59704:154-777(-)